MWFRAVTSAVQPGSITVVALASRTSAGPGRRSPASRAVRSYTGVACSAPWVHMATVSTGTGAPSARAGRSGSTTASPAAVASTASASATTWRPGVAKPKRVRCADVKASSVAAAFSKGTGRAASVPS